MKEMTPIVFLPTSAAVPIYSKHIAV